jgi:hypothetical protein
MGRHLISVVVLGASVWASACGASPAAPPQAQSTLQPVSLSIAGAVSEVAVGESFALQANIALSNGSTLVETAGVVWTSDDSRIVSIDQAGRATAVGEGSTVLRASVKNASSNSAVRVLRNLSGTWLLTFQAASCGHSSIPGCAGARFTGPQPQQEEIKFVQTGNRISTKWRSITAVGRIAADRSVTLEGSYCHIGEATVTEFTFRDWQMAETGSGRYAGSAAWAQTPRGFLDWQKPDAPCTQPATGDSISGHVNILELRRVGTPGAQ